MSIWKLLCCTEKENKTTSTSQFTATKLSKAAPVNTEMKSPNELLKKNRFEYEESNRQFQSKVIVESVNSEKKDNYGSSEISQCGLEFVLSHYGLDQPLNLEFIDINIRQWTINQVLVFLKEIGLQQYQDIFYKNKIKGIAVPTAIGSGVSGFTLKHKASSIYVSA